MFRFAIFKRFTAPRSFSRREQCRLNSGRPRGDNFSHPPQYWRNPTYRPPQVHMNGTPPRSQSSLTNFKPKMLRGFEPLAALEGKSFESGVRDGEAEDAHIYHSSSLSTDSYAEIPLYQPTGTSGNWYMYRYQQVRFNPLFTDTTSTISSAGSSSESCSIWRSSELSEGANSLSNSLSVLIDGDPVTRNLNPLESQNSDSTDIRIAPTFAAPSMPSNSYSYVNIQPMMPSGILPAYDAHPYHAYPEDPPPTYEEAILETGETSRYFLYEDESEALWELDNIINDYIDTVETQTQNSTTTAPSRTTFMDLGYPGYGDNRTGVSVDSDPTNYEWPFSVRASPYFPERFSLGDTWTPDFSWYNQSTDFFMY